MSFVICGKLSTIKWGIQIKIASFAFVHLLRSVSFDDDELSVCSFRRSQYASADICEKLFTISLFDAKNKNKIMRKLCEQ